MTLTNNKPSRFPLGTTVITYFAVARCGNATSATQRVTAVLGDDLQPVEPGSGAIGRVARRGHIPLGYFKDDAKTAATFVTGPDGTRWVVPGDLATVEEAVEIGLHGPRRTLDVGRMNGERFAVMAGASPFMEASSSAIRPSMV